MAVIATIAEAAATITAAAAAAVVAVLPSLPWVERGPIPIQVGGRRGPVVEVGRPPQPAGRGRYAQ